MTTLPAHAVLEAYCVLTRLPGGLAVTATTAAEVLAGRFPEPPLRLPSSERRRLLLTLAGAGIGGGASYDALVALEAATHDHTLLTLDRRALATYGRLGIDVRFVGA